MGTDSGTDADVYSMPNSMTFSIAEAAED